MDTAYHIRLATPHDVAPLPAIELAAARLFLDRLDALDLTPALLENTTSVADFARAQAAGILWVAVTAQDEPVGFALLSEIDGLLHLEELDVHPLHGRRGIGSALLKQVCTWAESAGYPGVTLSTFRGVPWNAPFYARQGFRVLQPPEWTPGLARLREIEQSRGLRTDLRVIMRCETGSQMICDSATPPV
jgi:GNAT superfamily N-acetyltransferase